MRVKRPTGEIDLGDFVKSTFWLVRIYFSIAPGQILLMVFSTIINALESVSSAYIFAKIVDLLVLSVADPLSSGSLLMYWMGIYLFAQLSFTAFNMLGNYIRRDLSFYSDLRIQVLLHQKLQSLGVATLEKPDVNNQITRARENLSYMFRYLTDLLHLGSRVTSAGAAFAIILSFQPVLGIALLFLSIPTILIDRVYLGKIWRLSINTTEERRSAHASLNHLLDTGSLQELRIVGGIDFLLAKFNKFFDHWYGEWKKLRRRWYRLSYVSELLILVGKIAGYIDVFAHFLAHTISIGGVTFYIRNIDSLSSGFTSIAGTISSMYEGSQRINELRLLFETKSDDNDGTVDMGKLATGPLINIDEVSFAYPRSKKRVIKGLSLNIKAGEKLAIVGHNGAGKTTLVKLLARFYPVTKGEITINGININELKIDSWYQNIGVLFQDFNTYEHLTAEENILLGRPKMTFSKTSLTTAAQNADAQSFIGEYKNGYQQILSEKYKGGIRPSTGQWQKIAIARFFYRNAPLVIFDEPTAAIDAVSEEKIFNKIYESFENKTVIIISHRFSTVRNADRIVVVEKGRIIEQGNHNDLMKLKGKYAKAFNIQAKGYKK